MTITPSIVLLTQFFPPTLVGGVETRFEAMACSAADAGMNVTVVITHGGESNNPLDAIDRRDKFEMLQMGWTDETDLSDLENRDLLVRAIREIPAPSVVWVANPWLVLVAKAVWPQVPLVLMPGQVHALDLVGVIKRCLKHYQHGGGRFALKHIRRDCAFRTAIRQCDLVVVPSLDQCNALKLPKNSRGKVRILQRGITLSRWVPARRERNVQPGDCLRLLVAARLDPVKNIEMMLRCVAQAIASDVNVNLRIVGSGPEEERLKQLSLKLNLANAVSFFPMSHAIEQHYRWADAFVMCSRNELFGNTVLEAIASGCPVILRKNSPPDVVIGCWEQVHGCPAIVPFSTYDDGALTRAIVGLARVSGRVRELSQQAVEWSENLDWSCFINQYVLPKSDSSS